MNLRNLLSDMFYKNVFSFLGICLKQNALTGIYLFLLLYLPLIKTPTPTNINGKFLIKINLIIKYIIEI